MTEDEALKKECCRDRAADCVGSACMAWRWEGVRGEHGLFDDAHAKAQARGLYRLQEGYEPVGFCGLAGALR